MRSIWRVDTSTSAPSSNADVVRRVVEMSPSGPISNPPLAPE